MSDSERQAHGNTRLKTDERLEQLLLDGLAGMKRELNGGLKAAKQQTEV